MRWVLDWFRTNSGTGDEAVSGDEEEGVDDEIEDRLRDLGYSDGFHGRNKCQRGYK
jgi:hypothetical protein